jgi:hypothetical protein
MSTTADYRKINVKKLNFSKLQSRGQFYFTATTYNKKPLIIKTPALITPTGIQPDGARSFVDLQLDVGSNPDHQDLYDFFRAIDDRCIDESIENMDKWFKGDVDERFIEEQFKSPITAGWGNEPSEMRVELVTENLDDIVDGDGNVIAPADVTSLSSVEVKLQLLGVWVSKEFLGTHWRALGVVANLDHESKGRRRASSPRRESSPLPPVTTRGKRGSNKSDSNKSGSNKSDGGDSEGDGDARRSRIESMLERFKAEEEEEEDGSSPREQEEEEYYRAGSDDDARRYSDDGDYYSDTDRRRYSDDDGRRSSYYDEDYYSDDGRGRYSDDEYDDYRSSSSRQQKGQDDDGRYRDDYSDYSEDY